MILPYFQEVVSGVEAKLAEGGNATVARKMLTLELARLGVRLFDGEHRVAWCGIATPYDLLAALDVTPCFVEFVGASLASTGMAGPMIESAEQAGFSTDSCAYHRAVIAADLAGLMPKPNFLIGTSCPCTGGLAVIENLGHHHQKPLFVVHVPPDDTHESAVYLAEQYKEMAAFAEGVLDERLDPDRLRHALELSNRNREILAEVYRLTEAVPSPARRRDMISVGITLPLLFGTEEGIHVAEAYRDEFAAKIYERGPDLPREPVRLMWLQNRVQFKNPLDQILEEEFGAVIVADELNDMWWGEMDLDDPYLSMAQRALASPLMLSAQRRAENLVVMAERYQIDGIINPCHWGCRQGTGTRGILQQHLREAGYPVLNLEVDCVDQRNFSEGQLRTRLEAFVEMLGQRRTAGV